MSWLTDKVAQIGTAPLFIAFNAHFWAAGFVVLASPPHAAVFAGTLLAAALKEFYFDAKYETTPKQTTFDNVTDFLGYAAGAALGLFLGGL